MPYDRWSDGGKYQEYDIVINSSSGHRSTQLFRVRRVRILGPVVDGRLPIMDLSDPKGPTEKAPYLTSILEIDGKSTGNRPARDGPALKPDDYVLVDPKQTVCGEKTAVVSRVLDRGRVEIRTLISKTVQIVPTTHVRKTTWRKLHGRVKKDAQGRLIRKSRRIRASHAP